MAVWDYAEISPRFLISLELISLDHDRYTQIFLKRSTHSSKHIEIKKTPMNCAKSVKQFEFGLYQRTSKHYKHEQIMMEIR